MPRNRHGLTALKARIKVRGLHSIDVRTAAGQALVRWRRDMLADLGGEAATTAQERALVEQACRTRLMLEAIDAWLLEQPSLVVRRRRAVLPVMRDRQQLADNLLRTLQALGLERRVSEPPSLASHLAARKAQPAKRETSTPEATPPAGDGAAQAQRHPDVKELSPTRGGEA